MKESALGFSRESLNAARKAPQLAGRNLVFICTPPELNPCPLNPSDPPMTQEQDDIITMFETTVAFLDTNNNTWKNMPAFVDAHGRAKAGTTAIRGKTGKQQVPTEGVTGDKAQIRDDLEEKLLVIGDAIAAFAAKTANNDLAAQVEMTRSSLDRLPDSDLIQTAGRVIEAAEANLAALAPFGVTATNKDALQAAVDLFANKKESPREAIVGRKVETLALPDAISSVRSIFRNELDKLMTTFKKPEPDFYNGYFASRIIVNHAATIPPKKPVPPSPPAGP